MTIVADTNVLSELFLPGASASAVAACWSDDQDWRLPPLWMSEFRHVLLKYLRVGQIQLSDALEILEEAHHLLLFQTMPVDSGAALKLAHTRGCSSYDAEFVVLAQQLGCPLLTFDRKLLQLFPDLAVQPGS